MRRCREPVVGDSTGTLVDQEIESRSVDLRPARLERAREPCHAPKEGDRENQNYQAVCFSAHCPARSGSVAPAITTCIHRRAAQTSTAPIVNAAPATIPWARNAPLPASAARRRRYVSLLNLPDPLMSRIASRRRNKHNAIMPSAPTKPSSARLSTRRECDAV